MGRKLAKRIGSLKRFITGKRTRWIIPAFAALGVLGSIAFYLFVRPAVLPQATIFFLDDIELPTMGQKVLVFAPHPDDETIGAGGYIAASLRNGASVKIVLVTDGSKGVNNNTYIRYMEFKKATAILGVVEDDLVFLDFTDGRLRSQANKVLYNRIKEQIELFDPDIVISPDVRDEHPDHAVTGEVIQQIMEEEGFNRTWYQYLVHYDYFFPQPRKFDPSLYLLPPIKLIDFDKSWHRFMLTQPIQDLKRAWRL